MDKTNQMKTERGCVSLFNTNIREIIENKVFIPNKITNFPIKDMFGI